MESITIVNNNSNRTTSHCDSQKKGSRMIPLSLRLRRQKCDYTDKTNDLHEVHIPFDPHTGIICCEDYLQTAISDTIDYCEKNHIYPAGDLAEFMRKRGYTFFNVNRSSGEISTDWEIETGQYITTCSCDTKTGPVCYIYLGINFGTPKSLHKAVNIDELCKMNTISDELKGEIMAHLNEKLHEHFKRYN